MGDLSPVDVQSEPVKNPVSRTVLCVGDNDVNRCVWCHALSAAGFDVIEAGTGAEALQLAFEKRPDLVVLDVRLPDLNGFEVCRRIKADARTESIPVVHLSAVGQLDNDLPEALAHLSDAYLREPVEPATLVATAKALIRAHEFQRSSRATFRRLLESALEGVWVVDANGRTEFVNQRMAEMLKCASTDELLGRDAFHFVLEDEREKLLKSFASRIASDGREHYEVRLRCSDGSVIQASASGSNLQDEQGRTIGRMAVFTDITAVKRMYDSLSENERRLALALEAAELGTWELDVASNVITADPRTCAMFGFDDPPQHIEQWAARMHPDDSEAAHAELRKAIAGSGRYELECRVVRPDGSTRWIAAKAVAVMDSAKRPVRIVGVAQDITSHKEMDRSLETERELLQGIVENIPVMLCMYDPQLRRFELNRAAQAVLGWNNAEASEGDFMAKVYPDPSYRAAVREYMQSLTPGWREWTITTRDGTQVPSEWANVCLSGNRIIGIGIDLRDRKCAEAELLRAHQRFQNVVESITDGLVVLDREWRFSYFSEAGAEMLGMKSADLLGRSILDVFPKTKAAGFVEWCERAVSTGRPVQFEEFYPEPVNRWLECRCYPFAEGLSIHFHDATERKNAEKALRESEEQFRTLANAIPQLCWMAHADGALFWYNQRWYEYTGTTPEQVRGWGWERVHDPDVLPVVVARWKRSIATGEHFEMVFPIRGADGEFRPFLTRVVPMRDAGGRITRWFGTNTDISAQRRTEQQLRASQATLEAALASMTDAVFISDAAGRFIRFNDSFASFHRFKSRDECSHALADYNDLLEVLLPDGTPVTLDMWAVHRALRGEAGVNVDYVLRRKDTGETWVGSYSFAPIRERDGTIAGAVVVARDITNSKRAEEAVRESEDKLRNAFANAAIGFAVTTPDGFFVDVNPAYCALTGYSAGELLSFHFSRLVHPDDADENMAVTRKMLCGEIKDFVIENRYIRKDGNAVWVRKSLSLVRDGKGAPRWIIALVENITGRKLHEQALSESEARERARAAELEAIMDAVPVATYIARDPECREISGNRMTYEMLRLPFGSNLSTSASAVSAPKFRAMKDGREVPPHELPAQKAAFTGVEIRDYEHELVFEDGSRIAVLGSAVPLLGEDGRPRGAVGALVDITGHKRSEERLRQAQKLESIGLLAGGIAHDFNNILTGILGYASLILDDVDSGPADRVREIVRSAERAAHLTRQLLAYSGKGQFVIRDIDVSDAVNEIADLVQFSIPKSADLAITVQRRLPPVQMDPSQLQQILMNLVINAGEAIGEGIPGTIRIATSVTTIEKSLPDAAGQDIQPGRYVSVEVSDTGRGIEPDQVSKIFDPFYTTKFTGRGLGLSAVAGIVRAQKGAIFLESAPGAGSTFRVLLPVAVSYCQDREEVAADNARATILVVDDEPTVRDVIGVTLRRRGYRVFSAADGREALSIIEQEEGAVDALVLDIVMPVMGANELLPTLNSAYPDIRILLTSGYSEAEARRLSACHPKTSFLQKPYTSQQITAAIETLLTVPRRNKAPDSQ